MKKRLLVIFLMLTMLSNSLLIVNADSKTITKGKITNPYGEQIVGVWIEVKDGTSGWAKLTKSGPGKPNEVNWSFDTQGKDWDARVGRGGTPQNWLITHISGWTYLQGDNVNMTLVENMSWLPPFRTYYGIVFK